MKTSITPTKSRHLDGQAESPTNGFSFWSEFIVQAQTRDFDTTWLRAEDRSRRRKNIQIHLDLVDDIRVLPAEQPTESPGQLAGVFPTTHWSIVAKAGDSRSPEADSAMEQLCQTYWYPLYVFVRRKGHNHDDASDLTQAFFVRFLEKRYLQAVDANVGKFRTFLLTSMTHFLANEWDKSQAQRRGGGCHVFSLDEAAADERYRLEPLDPNTPEKLFERRWAQTMMGVVLDRLAAEMEERRFEALKEFLLEDKGAVSYNGAAAQLRLSVAAITSAIHRMRGRFRVLLFEEVANTVETLREVEPELRHLLAALSD